MKNNNLMTKDLIQACRGQELKKVIEILINYHNGQKYFGTYTINNEVNFDRENAINTKELFIYADVFLNTMLEFDDVCVVGNNIINKKGEDIENIIQGFNNRGFEVKSLGTENSYNFENDLNMVLQYELLEITEGNEDVWAYDCDKYILLEVHTGGDVRSNYSPKILFKLTDINYFGTGMSIEGCVEDEVVFDTGIGIKEECEYNENENTWYYKGKEVSLWSSANSF